MALTRRTRRDLWLAAVFLWITPWAAALSIRFTARRSTSALSSTPFSAALMAFLVRVRISARTDLLRSRRFSFWRFRLIWLLMLATCVDPQGFKRVQRRDASPPVRGKTVAGGGPDLTRGTTIWLERRRNGDKAAYPKTRANVPGQAIGNAGRGRYDRQAVSPPATASGPVVVERIRNFSIISHVDHGKSTLSDRILEITGAVDPRQMREQYLDSMDIERERGITIKAQNVRVHWRDHTLHLIDTPGHVDFGYEVSRSLAACEGVVLLVDASQGIEAQTLANCYLALENDLEIVPVLNKIDLPAADPDRYAEEIERVLGLPADEILRISAKTGAGVPELLDEVVRRIPPPKIVPAATLRALIFDSYYDQYRGVVSAVRVVDGELRTGTRVRF